MHSLTVQRSVWETHVHTRARRIANYNNKTFSGSLPTVTLNPVDSHKTMYYIFFVIVINYGDSLPLTSAGPHWEK